MGQERTQAFERLYLFPGMYHCKDGEGPSLVDLLTPMMDWVEKGRAPEEIVAYQSVQEPDIARSRPVYPYPYIAAYDGRGDPDKETSYFRAAPLFTGELPDWAGADFFRPYQGVRH